MTTAPSSGPTPPGIPVTGCTEVSPGCDNCYAKTFAERFRGTAGHHFEQGFDLQLRPEKLDQPLRWRRPRRIFVNSMSDLFHDTVPDDYVASVWAVMALAPQHTFQVLTKRHGRMRSLLSSDQFHRSVASAVDQQWRRGNWRRGDPPGWQDSYRDRLTGWPLPNVWLGVSTENQRWADIRIPALLDVPAVVRFVSAEPLLGPIDLTAAVQRYRAQQLFLSRTGIDWVIVGGESGRRARPMHPDWARSIRDQCEAAGVPFLFKQWGEWEPGGLTTDPLFSGGWRAFRGQDARSGGYALAKTTAGSPQRLDDHTSVFRVGKTKAGRELDGRTWDELPVGVPLT